MSSLPIRQLTPEQYLVIERQASFKSEFYRGETFAMAGASLVHNMIQSNLIRHLGNHLDGTPCRVVGSDLRLCISATGLYTYPDAVIFCEPSQFLDIHSDTLLSPTVLIEVLSDSTEKYDRGVKSSQYREIESLQEYVLVSQSHPQVEVFQRLPDGNWLLKDSRGRHASLVLASLGIAISLSEVYAGVEFSNAD